jgi:hypothetical protein
MITQDTVLVQLVRLVDRLQSRLRQRAVLADVRSSTLIASSSKRSLS